MNDDETQVVPAEGSEEAQPESTQTTEAVVTPEPTAQPLSLSDLDRVKAEMRAEYDERERKLRAEFEKQARSAQSKSDKAYAAALAKARVIEENAEVLGLDAEQVKTAKQAVIDKEFSTAFNNAPSEQPTQPQTDVPPTLPPYVSRAELAQFLKENGLTENDVDLSAYENKPRYDDGLASRFQEDVLLAKAKQVEAKRVQQQNQQKAAQAAQVKANVGRVNPVPAGGAPSLGYDPVQELEKMDKMGLPDTLAERSKYKERYAKLMKEAYPD